jgi:histidine triad (HIT) family protein
MPMLPVNVFQKIIDREIPAEILHDDEFCVAFSDAAPKAPVHVLLVPKKVIRTHADLTPADAAVMGHLHLIAAELARELDLTAGYRLVLNCDEGGGQSVPHLHLHLLGGRPFDWPPG